MPKQKLPTPAFEGFLEADGAEFEIRFHEYNHGYAATKDYRFRYTTDEVEIGVRSNFDKWGNSVDYVCRPLPATQEDYDALKRALAKVIAEKRADGDGSFDIWPFVRQARRENRKAERLAAKRLPDEELEAA